MNEKELRVGFVFTGSFCTYDQVFPALAACKERFGEVIPILSNFSAVTDTRFGTAAEFAEKMTEICGQKPWSSIPEVEPIGPQKLLDVLVIAPCTGNTLGKMAAGITDTSATMAAKSHLRNGRPVVLGISTNDGLAVSLRNLGDFELAVRPSTWYPSGRITPAQSPFPWWRTGPRPPPPWPLPHRGSNYSRCCWGRASHCNSGVH